MNFIIKWFIGALAVLGTAYIVPGIAVSSFFIALVVAFIWGFISVFIKPVLHILALPITILTLGLFSFIINGLLFWFISSFVQGFEVDGFMPAVWGAIVISILGWLGNRLFIAPRKEKE